MGCCVGMVVIQSNGNVSFYVVDPVNTKTCTLSVIAGNINDPKGAAMYNMLLNAKSYGWKVSFDFESCNVTRMWVQ